MEGKRKFGMEGEMEASLGTETIFRPILGTDTLTKGDVSTNINTRLNSISAEFEDKSFEVLRLEYYTLNGKGAILYKQGLFDTNPTTTTTFAPSNLSNTLSISNTASTVAVSVPLTASSFSNSTVTGFAFSSPTTTASSFENPTATGFAFSNPTTTTSSFGNPTATAFSFSNPTTTTTTTSSFANPTTTGFVFSNPISTTSSFANSTVPGFSFSNPPTTTSSFANHTATGFSFSNPTTTGFSFSNPTTTSFSFANPTAPGFSFSNPTSTTSSFANPVTPSILLNAANYDRTSKNLHMGSANMNECEKDSPSSPIDMGTQTEADLSASKLHQGLKEMLISNKHSDFTAVVKEKEFRVHKIILAAHSPVFASMVEHDTKEKATGIVNIDDCEPIVFTDFLNFLYTESIENINLDNVLDLYEMADKYQVTELSNLCLKYMMNNISIANFCDIMRLGLRHHLQDLIEVATQYFLQNSKEIATTSEWGQFLVENPVAGNELFLKVLNLKDKL